MEGVKSLDYLMLIFIVGVLILILTLMIYSNVKPSTKNVEEEVEGLKGYRKDKYPLMEGMEDGGDKKDKTDEEGMKDEEDDEKVEDDAEVVVKEPEAADPEMFCFGSFCSQKKVEGFSSRDTIKAALKKLF